MLSTSSILYKVKINNLKFVSNIQIKEKSSLENDEIYEKICTYFVNDVMQFFTILNSNKQLLSKIFHEKKYRIKF